METTHVSREAAGHMREDIALLADNGGLTEAKLDNYVASIADQSDGPDCSIGTEWIIRHIAAFAAIIANPLAFFERHADNRYFAGLVILYADLLKLLPETARAGYIRRSIMHWGAWNMEWTKAAIVAGVAREQLASIVFMRLGAMTTEELRCVNFMGEFLRYGCGRVERAHPIADSLRAAGVDDDEIRRVGGVMKATSGAPSNLRFVGAGLAVATTRDEDDRRNWCLEKDTPWDVLDDEQFERAVRICCIPMPGSVFEHHARIRLRLDDDAYRRILAFACDSMKVVSGPLEALRQVPLVNRIELARRMRRALPDLSFTHSGAFVAKFLTELDLEIGGGRNHDRACEFWAEMRPLVARIQPQIFYRATAKIRAREYANPLMTRITEQIRQTLEAGGYVIGRVEEGKYIDRRTGQVRREWQLNVGATRYVQSRDQHRYFAKAGDTVIVHKATARFLSAGRGGQTVYAAYFIPANSEEDYA